MERSAGDLGRARRGGGCPKDSAQEDNASHRFRTTMKRLLANEPKGNVSVHLQQGLVRNGN